MLAHQTLASAERGRMGGNKIRNDWRGPQAKPRTRELRILLRGKDAETSFPSRNFC